MHIEKPRPFAWTRLVLIWWKAATVPAADFLLQEPASVAEEHP